jgi:hypothetical protein
MIALLVSYFLLAYLLAPRVIFRAIVSSLPLKFQRTRSEEISFAIWIAAIPLACLWLLLLVVGLPSSTIWTECKDLFAASYSEAIFAKDPEQFWTAIRVVSPRQLQFLVFYYLLVVVEASIFILLVKQYGTWRKWRPYEWFVENFLLSGINEWYLLLTVANFPRQPKRKVAVDLLTTEDHLYQGDLADYFVDSDGSLSGLYLENPRRFSRHEYLRAKEKDSTVTPDSFWKGLAGGYLYIPNAHILNLNVRYPLTELPSATPTTLILKNGMKIKLQIMVDDSGELPPAKPEKPMNN